MSNRVPTNPLSTSEIRLTGSLLNLAKNEFTNHGAGDFQWPDWFPQEERYPFALALRESLGDPKEAGERALQDAGGKLAPSDWELMRYLADRIEVVSEMESSPWTRIMDERPPDRQMVLFSWGTLEGSAMGYRFTKDGFRHYSVGGSLHDGDDPEWWMPVPKLPRMA